MMKWSPTTDDDLRAEIKARKAPPMTDRTMEALSWKPIETAPKDRGELLVKRGSRLHLVSWFDCWRYDGAPRPGWVMDGGHIVEPTHWLASEADLVALSPEPVPPQEGGIAEVEKRLKLECDFRDEDVCAAPEITADIRAVLAELSRLSALVKALKEALEPFAREADTYSQLCLGEDIDYWPVKEIKQLTLGDLRRARALSDTE